MKKILCTIVLSLCGLVAVTTAQDTYVGAQFVRLNPDIRRPNLQFDKQSDSLGVVASETSYFSKSVGLTGEASANFTTGDQSKQLYTAMGGLTAKYKGYTSVQPFVSAVAGLGVLHVDKQTHGIVVFPSQTLTSGAFKVSTGVDIGTGRVKWRAFEAGYLQTQFAGKRQDNFVLSTGFVF